ncbi:hypothetical protein PVAP13_3KG206124, partial [Panicum virgatum]
GGLSRTQEGRSGLLLPPVVAPGFGFVPPPLPLPRTVVWLPLPPSTSTADPAPDGRKYQQSILSSRFRIYTHPRRSPRSVRHRAAGTCLASSGRSCRRAFRQDPSAASVAAP